MVFPLLRQSAGVSKIPNLFWSFDIGLRFVCNLVLGVWDFINSSTPKQLAIFAG
jgi:hypothetical protein